MFARFDENPAMTLRVIKETKRYGRTDGRTDARTDGRTDGRTDNVKTVYPLQTKFAGGIKYTLQFVWFIAKAELPSSFGIHDLVSLLQYTGILKATGNKFIDSHPILRKIGVGGRFMFFVVFFRLL